MHKGRPATREVGQSNGQGHRNVHGQVAVAQPRGCTHEKGPSGDGHHRCRDDQCGPPQQLQVGVVAGFSGPEVNAKGIHHDLHHSKPGDAEPDQKLPPLFVIELFLLAGAVGVSAVAKGRQTLEQPTEGKALRVPFQGQGARVVVDLNL